VIVRASQSPVGAQFAKSQGPVLNLVGRNTDGFTNDGQPPGTASGSESVLVRQSRVLFEKQIHHCQVSGNFLCIFFGKCFQLNSDAKFDVLVGDFIRDDG
jgi:hypothetical protein